MKKSELRQMIKEENDALIAESMSTLKNYVIMIKDLIKKLVSGKSLSSKENNTINQFYLETIHNMRAVPAISDVVTDSRYLFKKIAKDKKLGGSELKDVNNFFVKIINSLGLENKLKLKYENTIKRTELIEMIKEEIKKLNESSTPKQVRTAVNKVKKQLVNKWKTKGAYENFGQKEVRKLEDKYIDISSYTDEMNQIRDIIQDFNHWSMNYTGE